MNSSQSKTLGYVVSIVSVLLLAVPPLKSAKDDPWILTALILGVATSITGMGLRWRSHRQEQAEKGRE